jgi:2-phospho-L-lactate guanylyltransferase
MISAGDIWAVLPIKETRFAKQRLAQVFSQEFRRKLALAMFEDVMRAVAAVPELGGIAVVTIDPAAAGIAIRLGAQIWTDGARDGHTGAVAAAARRLAVAGASMLTLPGDIPLATAGNVPPAQSRHSKLAAFSGSPWPL